MPDAQDLLSSIFGFDAFRPGQAEIVDAVVAGQDVLAIMPTGGGKSLCFQLAAVAAPGVTLVVTPLISLMLDQLQALRALGGVGVPVAYLNGQLPKAVRPSLAHPQSHTPRRAAR